MKTTCKRDTQKMIQKQKSSFMKNAAATSPIEAFLLRYSTMVWTLKQRIVQSHGPSTINSSTIVFMARFPNKSLD